MKCAVIDIGSNSMRLSVYDAEGGRFQVLFKEKVMAGLAGYVEKGRMSQEGIDCAIQGLLKFRGILRLLAIEQSYVFATASLRNIRNTDDAVAQIRDATGFAVEVISGGDEARFSYIGAMQELSMPDGMFVDIGGASTEVAVCEGGRLLRADSMPIGSLKLFREHVKRIIPGKGAQAEIEERIDDMLSACLGGTRTVTDRLACVGGTARAVAKLICRREHKAGDTSAFTAQELEDLWDLLRRGDKTGIDFILRYEPERIHTLLPGIMILRQIVRRFHVSEIIVSRYGVREGYLCQRILSQSAMDGPTPTPRIGN